MCESYANCVTVQSLLIRAEADELALAMTAAVATLKKVEMMRVVLIVVSLW